MSDERILAIDVGLGTTDILLFDPDQPPENSVNFVVPSRTQIVAREIRAATQRRLAVVFHGPTMGGGPSTAAMRGHLAEGLDFVATEQAALTFADNVERVRDHGVRLIAEHEVQQALARGAVEVRSGDVDVEGLFAVLARLGVPPVFSGAGVAVQDHGFSPTRSNRIVRFELWEDALERQARVADLFYAADEIPGPLTRMQSAAGLLQGVPRVLAADTGPAALYGALEGRDDDAVLVNVGNGHTICVVTCAGKLTGIFEHHTRALDGPGLTALLRRFLAGELPGDEVREAGGHGAALRGPVPDGLPLLVTGPHRDLLRDTELDAVFPAPFGDMMLTGPVGLVCAYCRRHGIDMARWKTSRG